MHLTFLGTGAGVPSLRRNVSSLALTLCDSGECWLFDCGEATQHQLMRSQLRPGKLTRIFITHLHGDHLFGLPGLLTSRSMGDFATPLTVYGPTGLKTFVETTLSLSGSWMCYPLNIVEISAGKIVDDQHVTVTAYALNHVIECYGYRIETATKPGKLNVDQLGRDAIPTGPWLKQIKLGEAVCLPDGRVINGERYLGPSIPGKKVAIFGDTAPTEHAQLLAADVDLMVHEATLEAAMFEKANRRGHSTSAQAARAAVEANAKRLIVTHFSSRYHDEDLLRLLAECRTIFPATDIARDFANFSV